MLVGIGGDFRVVVLGQLLLILLVPNIAQPLEEEQPENVVLIVGRVDLPAKDIGRACLGLK